jgi:prephenate dehydratase
MKVAIQGEPGSFSHEAALKMDAGAEILPCALSAEVFRALNEGRADAAAIPIENSLAGSVLEHFDLLLSHDVRVEREALVRIHHNLIAMPGVAIGEVQRVSSHPVALAQCRRFLAAHPEMETIAFYDTAGSVKHLMERCDRHAAGIASTAAAKLYGGEILEAGIEDNPENYTRFFLVRRAAEATVNPGTNKMSVAFALEHRPGTLVGALNALSVLGTNLTKIESRPVHGKPWEYIFYVDCQIAGPGEADLVLKVLKNHCSTIRELGRYAEAKP